MGAALDDLFGQQDASLIARHRAGDTTAFEALYGIYHQRLLRFVRGRVHETDMVEELTQEAFARAYAALDRLRDTTRFYPWLVVIARRLILDHYRLRVRVTAVADLDTGAVDEGPDGQILQRQIHADLATALLRIKPRHREVLRLRESENLSYEEMAKALGVPVTTIPPLLFRARAALRREYLAVTQEERSWLFLPVTYLIGDALRRVRDRAVQFATYLPDPQYFTAPVAAVAITVAALGGGAATLPPQQVEQPAAAGTSELAGSTGGVTPVPASVDALDAEAEPQGIGRLNHVNVDQDDVERGRESDRRMPYYFEFGDHAIGLDPQQMRRDVESSLAGDHEWMEMEEDTACIDASEPCS